MYVSVKQHKDNFAVSITSTRGFASHAYGRDVQQGCESTYTPGPLPHTHPIKHRDLKSENKDISLLVSHGAFTFSLDVIFISHGGNRVVFFSSLNPTYVWHNIIAPPPSVWKTRTRGKRRGAREPLNCF